MQSIDGPAITMISGAPGIGKTETLLDHCRENEEAIYVAIAAGAISVRPRAVGRGGNLA